METKVKSLDKALRILRSFTLEEPELGISDISRRLELSKSNVYNIISTMEQNSFIEKNEATGKYRLGLEALQLSHVVLFSRGYQGIIRRCVQELSEAAQCTACFGVIYDDTVMCIENASFDGLFDVERETGTTVPLTCTDLGKAILAFSTDVLVNRVLSKPIKQFTPDTITDPDLLRAELMITRQRGYSMDHMEYKEGLKGLGVPVLNRADELIGALSLSGVSSLFYEDTLESFIILLKSKATYIRNSL